MTSPPRALCTAPGPCSRGLTGRAGPMSSFCFQGPQLLLPSGPRPPSDTDTLQGVSRAGMGPLGRSPVRVDHAISKRPASQQQGRERARSSSPSLQGEWGPQTRHSVVHCPSQTQSGNKATAMNTFPSPAPGQACDTHESYKACGHRAMGELVRLCSRVYAELCFYVSHSGVCCVLCLQLFVSVRVCCGSSQS